MLINIDISTGYMYKDGPLIGLCTEFLTTRQRRIQPQQLAPRQGFPERERYRLEKFVAGVRVITTGANGQPSRSPRTIKKLSTAGASDLVFAINGQQISLGNGALIPLEMCTVPPGQIMRKQIPDDKVKDVVQFATKRPEDRLASIRMGLGRPSQTPREGTWNMVDRKFYKPSTIERWCVVVFERENSFGRQYVQNVIQGFVRACQSVGELA
ncbi:hypothetical protein EIP86_004804 [Pleurotus ostreatoroseus]|nr:hypothetical protein EIP86_004804 [Pleurotus ostreatoroseus]